MEEPSNNDEGLKKWKGLWEEMAEQIKADVDSRDFWVSEEFMFKYLLYVLR
jgi:hypothetical protein